MHALWGERVRFVDVLIRQAHPGPGVRPYRSAEEKTEDARRYKEEYAVRATVLVDELAGTVHQVYGGLADPTYLIDVDGRVAYYNMWTHAPTLHRAIGALLSADGRGIVRDGIDHTPHMLPAMADGWRGIRRGLPQSFIDLVTAAPGMASSIWLGHQMRPALRHLALRAKPLPVAVRVAMAVSAAVVVGVAVTGIVRRFSSK